MKDEIKKRIDELPKELDLLPYDIYLEYINIANRLYNKEISNPEFNKLYVENIIGKLDNLNGREFMEILSYINQHFLGEAQNSGAITK